MRPAELTPDLFERAPTSARQQNRQAARRYAEQLPRTRGGAKVVCYRRMIDSLLESIRCSK